MENNLPQGWEFAPLSDLVQYRKGKKPKQIQDTPFPGSVPYLDIKAIEKNIEENFVDTQTSTITDSDELVLVWDGARAGWVGISRKGAVGSTMMALRPRINKLYLYRFLQTQFEYLQSNHRGTGIPHVDPDILWKIEVPVAPWIEQERIVSRLDALFEKIELNKKRLEHIPQVLKRFRQSVLVDAVRGRLTKEWRKNNHVTENWKEKRLGDLVEVIGGYAYKSSSFQKNGSNQVFRIGNIKPYELYYDYSPVFINDDIAKSTERFEVKECDILISMTGTKYKRDYGFAGMLKISDRRVFVNQRVSNIKCNKEINPHFLLHWLQTDDFRDQFFAGETGNVNQGNVGMEGIREAKIQLPSINEQIEIVRIAFNLLDLANKIESRFIDAQEHFIRLPHSILSKAFRGELVPQDPKDEPSALFLERIKRGKNNIYRR
jgi:type I restriction enzyme, S subunit